MWSKIGNVFARIGKYALKAAVWAEAHPEVIQEAVQVATVVAQSTK